MAKLHQRTFADDLTTNLELAMEKRQFCFKPFKCGLLGCDAMCDMVAGTEVNGLPVKA
jgi:hypothetical protein